MGKREIYGELVKVYAENDVDLFRQLNNEFDLGLTSIEQIELIEDRPSFDLSMYYTNYNAQYIKNYTTSRFIINIEPLPKHILKEPELKIVSYSYMIYHVLTGLQANPKIDEVLSNVDLQFPNDFARDLLESKGFIEIYSDGSADITDYGYFRLSGVNWVGFYEKFLDYFDFDDFERYMQENDTGSVISNSLNYLDEHLKIAYDKKEFDRLHNVFSSKAMIYLNGEEFKKSLIEELKIFTLKLNPVYLDKIEYDSYNAIEFPNINNISELYDLAEVKSLKRILYKAWMDVELDEMLMTKKEAYGYLQRAFDGEMLDELSDEVANKYFK